MSFEKYRSEPEFSQRPGFSLVEVMLALLLGSLLMLGAGQLFKSANETYWLLEGQSRMQQNARLAMTLMIEKVRSAGWFGCRTAGRPVFKTLRGDWSRLFEFNIQVPLEGVAGTMAGWLDARHRLPVSSPSNNGRSYIAGRGLKAILYHSNSITPGTSGLMVPNSDVLITRQLASESFRLAQPLVSDGDPVIQVSNSPDHSLDSLNNFGFSRRKDPVLMISNCQQADIFRVTSISNEGQGRAKLQHAVQNSQNPFTNAQAGLSAYDTDAYVAAIETSVFFIATGLGVNNRNQPVLALWHKQATARPQELIAGIEGIKLIFGLDTDNDQVPNRYLAATEIHDFSNVVSLRILLLASSVDAVPSTAQDKVLRRVFMQTVWLRNA